MFFRKLGRLLNNHHFSKRLVMIYTCIVIVPLSVLFVILMMVYKRNYRKDIQDKSRQLVLEKVSDIQKRIERFENIEKMINSNAELLSFLMSPEEYSDSEIIDKVISTTSFLEKILTVESDLSSLRIFSDNQMVPERSPVLFSSSRTDLESLERWEFGYNPSYIYALSYKEPFSICTTRKLLYGSHKVGYLQIAADPKNFLPFMYKELKEGEGYCLLKADNHGDLSLCKDRQLKKACLIDHEALRQILNEYDDFSQGDILNFTSNGKDYIGAIAFVPELNLAVIHAKHMPFFESRMLAVYIVFVIGLSLTMIFFFTVIALITTRMLGGVYSIIDGMKEIRSGNLDVHVPVSSTIDEISLTQTTFNTMVEKIKEQIEMIKTEEHLIADTEMKAMQNQINAHFLYNVLETIHMQALLKDDDETAESILVLGKMMRYCLRWRVHSVTLSQELEYINSYIKILNIRNDYKITLQAEIPEKLLDREIPKMLVQPFVENSFYHGIEPLACDSVIKIYTEVDTENEILFLCVQDFGLGIPEEKLAEIRSYLEDVDYERDSQGSIGVKNIQQRLFLFYGEDFKLQIISSTGKGTLIKVPLPLSGDKR